MVTPKANEAANKAHVIDEETRKTLNAVKRQNNRSVIAFVISWSILLVVGIFGIYKQNQIAQSNKNHIDCIIKLFVTPSTAGQTRHITDLSTCQITVK